MIKANAIEVGDIHVVDNPHDGADEITKVEFAMILKFDSAESIRQAMQDGEVRFSVFGGD